MGQETEEEMKMMKETGDVFIMRYGKVLFDNKILTPILQAWWVYSIVLFL